MIKNSFWFRHFLLCNDFANRVMNQKGFKYMNFANLIQDEKNGRFANSQMTIYFWIADSFFCNLHSSDEEMVFSFLEDENITIEQLASLEQHQLEDYFNQYCIGIIKI